MKYISKAENLCLMMNLLRDDAKSIQYEAFHVFKVFVANPNRPQAVTSILEANKEKLMHFLGKFHEERDKDDAQFAEERQTLIDVLQGI
jgi:calcium binding protein 39